MTNRHNNQPALKGEDLRQFTGTAQYWKSGLPWHPFLYTDGVQYLAAKGEAYWLLDLIGSWQAQPQVKDDPILGEMQFWTLTVNENRSAIAICERDSGDVAAKQVLGYTDFPLPKVRLYLAHMVCFWRYSSNQGPRTNADYGMLLLPSEY